MVFKIALDLDQQRPTCQQRSDRMGVDILDVHLFEPTGLMMRAIPIASFVRLLNCILSTAWHGARRCRSLAGQVA